ncbi:MAG: DNA polymerase III subunit gamma/tau [Oscillospiraceae bacterium]|nr:DNA polymerase III subunit gamma/tau [Oscillospiraceae bacterium]
MYQALYRKWRPKTFDEVVGQEHITEILKKQVLLGRLSHAYLFTGTRGTGKTSCAKILAKAVNCVNPVGGNPCGKCPICMGIDSGSILDVTEMDAASNNGVDNVRALREEAVYTPAAASKRVYIIDEVHMLSVSAFNALLKILEEPPEHLIFILATTELHKVPATILSRCQRYSFRRVPQRLIRERLSEVAKAEGMELTDQAADMLARLADGSLRDALSLLDQCSGEHVDRERILSAIGLAENEEIYDIMSAVASNDAGRALEVFDGLYRSGKDSASVLGQLAALHRDLLLARLAPEGGTGLMSGGFSREMLSALGDVTSESGLIRGLERIQDALAQLGRSSDRRISGELCIINLCLGSGGAPEPERAASESAAPTGRKRGAAPAERPAEEKGPAQPEKNEPAPVEKNDDPKAEERREETPPERTKAESGSADGRYTWKQLLELLENRLEVPQYMLLIDEAHARGEIAPGKLTVLAGSEFSRQQFDDEELKKVVAEAASELAGTEVKVSVELRQEKTESKSDKLDSFMSEFGIREEK